MVPDSALIHPHFLYHTTGETRMKLDVKEAGTLELFSQTPKSGDPVPLLTFINNDNTTPREISGGISGPSHLPFWSHLSVFALLFFTSAWVPRKKKITFAAHSGRVKLIFTSCYVFSTDPMGVVGQ